MSLAIQIKALAEQGASPAEIAEGLNLEVQTVEFELARIGQIAEEDIPEADFAIIRANLIEIAKDMGTSFPERRLAADVGKFLWEQKRGSAKTRHAPPVNIGAINTVIMKSNERIREQLAKRFSNNQGAGGSPLPPQENPPQGQVDQGGAGNTSNSSKG
jgi:hypothetical protein